MKAEDNAFPYLRLVKQSSDPTDPPSGSMYLVVASDGTAHLLDDDGTVVAIGGGGGGGGGPLALGDLTDVDLATTAPVDMNRLVYDAGSDTWVPAGGSGTVDASDVAVTAVGGISSTDVQAALAELDTEKAALASPVFTGNPTAPTPTLGDNDFSVATTAFVKAALDALINSAPGTLDTLGEIATQLATDESAVSALVTTVAGKIAVSLVDAKGDLLVGTADNTIARVAAGADGTVVMYDSAQTPGLKSRALDDSDVAPVAPNAQTGTTYTFVLADGRRLVTASNAAAQTYTVPTNSSIAYPLGTVLSITQKGAGQVTLLGGGSGTVVLNSAHGLKISAQWATVSLTKIDTDTWVVSGDTTT